MVNNPALVEGVDQDRWGKYKTIGFTFGGALLCMFIWGMLVSQSVPVPDNGGDASTYNDDETDAGETLENDTAVRLAVILGAACIAVVIALCIWIKVRWDREAAEDTAEAGKIADRLGAPPLQFSTEQLTVTGNNDNNIRPSQS